MTYACWELAKDPALQDRVRAELLTVAGHPGGTDDLLTNKELEPLPYFNGFLKEVLRVWPTLPGPLERIVPNEGADLCGVYLPGGTEVTSLAYAIHRDESIFPDALKIKPERWNDETAEMRAAFLTFSTGARAVAAARSARMSHVQGRGTASAWCAGRIRQDDGR
jgi:cytochrome P450